MTWRLIQDQPATAPQIPAGVFSSFRALNATSYDWDVSDANQFPANSYILRLECFLTDRKGQPLDPISDLYWGSHYSYQVKRIFIKR